MSIWFEKGRPAILAAVKAACEQLDQEYLLVSQNESSHDEIVRSRDQLATVDALKEENAKLRAELESLGSDRAATVTALDVRSSANPPVDSTCASTSDLLLQPTSSVNAGPGTDWAKDHYKLRARFNALSENFKKAKAALQKRKDERDKWIQHATLLEDKIKAAEQAHGIRILEPSSAHVAPKGEAAHNTKPANAPSDASFISEQLDGEAPTEAGQVTTTTALDPSKTDMAELATSGFPDVSSDELPALPPQTCHDDLAIKEEPSSDAPVVVSERATKRRRLAGPTESVKAPRVKSEPRTDSSSPLSIAQSKIISQESLDLGEVAKRTLTPRKRKELEELQSKSVGERATVTTTSLVQPDRRAQLPSESRAYQTPAALAPLSVNQRLIRPATDKPLKKGLDRGIACLAEDGFHEESSRRNITRSDIKARSAAKGRLDALLNSPTPANESALLRSRRNGSTGLGSRRAALPVPERRELPFQKQLRRQEDLSNGLFNPASPQVGPPTGGASRTESPQRSPRKRPAAVLRNKPLKELHLDDFRINPQANEGHDFAFTDVVRDKDARACLPGCTDMHCCGKDFRNLALSELPNGPLTAAQRQDEQRLLEKHLGDYSYKLAGLNKQERQELWVEARTRELADKYGTHRHRFSRMRSPPGFWNADFPSTQELEDDRTEAAKRERAAVEGRYREALRPSGVWMFRDE